MHLRAGRRTLRRIETDLTGCDSELAGLFAMFTRLTRDEKMPGTERLRVGPVRMLAARLRGAAGRRRPATRSRTWLGPTLPLATALGLYCTAGAGGIRRYVAHAGPSSADHRPHGNWRHTAARAACGLAYQKMHLTPASCPS